ncbi:LytR/AlgR family response regulator transcription factor [Alteromonas sp. ASW11-130]|uniref:LytR/AlgR family response regulator transcription factor n=1 Tax=Alteromonas sp. ASW11-130 TaxID=3015775 RepID=UPI00224237A1|nr:LytTR family DNA-binding domain-containing protein [Alteromonas sp. ASW11-130]MCW8090999.1 LytTR family DNA-binding domain-containing protein [Alteromonas sp. ASW11-130]
MPDVLIVDDEVLACETIQLLLSNDEEIERIWQAHDAHTALSIAYAEYPNIVILDIEIPGLPGIELAKKLPPSCVVIFASAYSEFALSAFEVDAIDYLLKPFTDERFYQSIGRAKAKLKLTAFFEKQELTTTVIELMERQQAKYKERIAVRDPGRIRFIDIEDIVFITGAGNYAEIHLLNGNHILHRETLCNLEAQLNPKEFVRIHRSSIVRRNFIAELRPNEKGDYAVILDSGENLTMSRRNKDKIYDLIR